jgi:hypothetical protein
MGLAWAAWGRMGMNLEPTGPQVLSGTTHYCMPTSHWRCCDMALAHTQHARGNTCPYSMQSDSIQTSRASRLGDQCHVGDAALLRPGGRGRARGPGPGPGPRCLAPRPTPHRRRRAPWGGRKNRKNSHCCHCHCPLPTAHCPLRPPPTRSQEPGARSTTT